MNKKIFILLAFIYSNYTKNIKIALGQIEVLSMLGDNFNVTLEMEELVSIKTIRDIIKILNSKNIFFD